MTQKYYTVYDSKAEAYLPPFLAPNTGVATRMFTDVCNDPKHEFNKHAEDYTLFEIGEFDSLSGCLVSYEAKKSLGLAKEFVKNEV